MTLFSQNNLIRLSCLKSQKKLWSQACYHVLQQQLKIRSFEFIVSSFKVNIIWILHPQKCTRQYFLGVLHTKTKIFSAQIILITTTTHDDSVLETMAKWTKNLLCLPAPCLPLKTTLIAKPVIAAQKPWQVSYFFFNKQKILSGKRAASIENHDGLISNDITGNNTALMPTSSEDAWTGSWWWFDIRSQYWHFLSSNIASLPSKIGK